MPNERAKSKYKRQINMGNMIDLTWYRRGRLKIDAAIDELRA
jgi:recombinational DNA repair protein (RecF pathway)